MGGSVGGLTRRSLTLALPALGLLGALPAQAASAKRVALLIGISRYDFGPHLRNTIRDTQLIETALGELGFTTATVSDPTRVELMAALEAFRARSSEADAAIVYYAGHGAEIAGVNYLLPRDIGNRSSQLAAGALPVGRLREAVLPASRVRLVLLDACRDVPEGMDVSDIGPGLGRETGGLTAQVVTLMAAAPGQAALDGEGDHGPFALALSAAFQRPGITVGELPRVVQVEVQRITQDRQTPDQQGIWSEIFWSFDGRFGAEAQTRVQARHSREQAFWQTIRNSKDPADFRAYVEATDRGEFTGLFRAIAVNRMVGLERKTKSGRPPASQAGQRAIRAFQSGDYGAAVAAWQDMAATGSAAAMYNLGVMYFNGRGAPVDMREAASWFRRAAESGNEGGMVNYGLCLLNGYGVPPDPQGAARSIRRAAEGGLASAMGLLGLLYLSGQGLPQDKRLAVAWLRQAADAGDGPSMIELGAAFGRGEGAPKDPRAALAMYRRAADAGEGQGMVLMGYAYEEGSVVPRDLVQAATWYQRAAEAGDGEGMAALAVMFETGAGLPQDLRRAVEYYRLSVARGHPQGMLGLGSLFALGKGVPKDLKAAAKLFQQASDLGNGPATRNLAVLYETGGGVPRDLAKAIELYKMALALGDAGAAGELARLRVQ